MAIQNSQSKQLTLAGKQKFQKQNSKTYLLKILKSQNFYFEFFFEFAAPLRNLSVYYGTFPFLSTKPATMAKFY